MVGTLMPAPSPRPSLWYQVRARGWSWLRTRVSASCKTLSRSRHHHGFAWNIELVAGAVDRHEVPRAFRLVLERAPQLDEVVIDGARVRLVLVTPRLVEERVATHDLAGPAREHLQDRERAARQVEPLAALVRDLADEIDLDIAERETARLAIVAGRTA